MESVGVKPEGIGSIPVCLHNRRIAQLVEQMTVNHPVAGSNPAPALRFSLKS